MFLFLCFSFLKTESLTGEWNIYEEFPGPEVYTVAFSQDEQVSGRFEITSFINDLDNKKENYLMEDSIMFHFWVDILETGKKGVAFEEIQDQPLFSLDINDQQIEATHGDTKYIIKSDNNDKLVIKYFGEENMLTYYAKRVKKQSTFDMGRYQYIFLGITVAIAVIQVFLFRITMNKQQKAYQQERQMYLKKIAEEQKRAEEGEGNNEEEEENIDEIKVIKRKSENDDVVSRKPKTQD